MRTLANLLQLPGKTAPDSALLDHLHRLRAAIDELEAAEVEVSNELARRRAVHLIEHIRRDVIGQ